MSVSDVFDPPPAWTNQPLRLYHGTTAAHAAAILNWGVRVSASRDLIDFGRGFYTTTIERQARAWAWHITRRRGGAAAVICADIDREALAQLECLVFVRGDYSAESFWSFVVHCRSVGTDHARSRTRKKLYDMVAGPVTANWTERGLMADTDQISFHTPEAEAMLNGVSWRILQ